MSQLAHEMFVPAAINGEPEVVEDARERANALRTNPNWISLRDAASALQELQIKDGSIPEADAHGAAAEHVAAIVAGVRELSPLFAHDAEYHAALIVDFERWAAEGFGVPDFYDSLVTFHPATDRQNGRTHLVVFPMYTQNGSSNRYVEAVLCEVIWPEFIGDLEAGDYSNALFVPIRFIDFTAGYDTNSAVLFPESVGTRAIPTFTWGGIFADREAARFRTVLKAAADTTRLELPADAQEMLDDQELTERTFVMWDLIHDRTHMRGDLPFDPFMIKQRMPFFLYTLEELRCDLTAFREATKIERALAAQAAQADGPELTEAEVQLQKHAKLVQYAVIFDRIFRFALTGSRVRNYDGLGGQLLFAWMHQHHVLHWTDTKLTIDWDEMADVVIALGAAIDDLYWRSIDRPKVAHWLAAYELITAVVTPNPSSTWAKGPEALPLDGPPRGLTDAVMDDEFPLSMFYEALGKKIAPVIESTRGITA